MVQWGEVPPFGAFYPRRGQFADCDTHPTVIRLGCVSRFSAGFFRGGGGDDSSAGNARSASRVGRVVRGGDRVSFPSPAGSAPEFSSVSEQPYFRLRAEKSKRKE